MGNNGGDLVTLGPSIAPFRRDRDDFIMHPNHIFAFEYAVHLNIPERPWIPAEHQLLQSPGADDERRGMDSGSQLRNLPDSLNLVSAEVAVEYGPMATGPDIAPIL